MTTGPANRPPDPASTSIDPVDPGDEDARAALTRYAEELDHRFHDGFATPADDPTAATMRPPGGGFWVVRAADGAVIGCGGIRRLDATTAEVKRMWVAPEVRGRGIATRLLAHLEKASRDLGCTRIVLDTAAELVEAIGLYERSGYVAVPRYNDNPDAAHWFAKEL